MALSLLCLQHQMNGQVRSSGITSGIASTFHEPLQPQPASKMAYPHKVKTRFLHGREGDSFIHPLHAIGRYLHTGLHDGSFPCSFSMVRKKIASPPQTPSLGCVPNL